MNQNEFRTSNSCEHSENRWSALDSRSDHPLAEFCGLRRGGEEQEGRQENVEYQLSEELVYIKDSCDVRVTSTDVKAALSLQAALQAAIAVIVSITVGSSESAERITQELLQSSKISQISRQKTIIENSRDVEVVTTDAQVAVNIQLLLQLLLALIVEVDVL
ncbi:spore coat protein [Bacillus cihuensis]|uniref:spore coat protein n=1 Tax=Bacillus cihuensis TaxID=1208599 RepID=UPI00041C7C54|nr:spore coat protein [Bacillus cihuensis]